MVNSRGSGLLAAALLAGCGGGGGAGPTMTPGGTTTTTFMGTSAVDAAGGCSSASRHDFSAGEGTIQVTLVQALAGAAGVQVCHPTAANHNTDRNIFLRVGGSAAASSAARPGGGRAERRPSTPIPAGVRGPPGRPDLVHGGRDLPALEGSVPLAARRLPSGIGAVASWLARR